MKNLLLILVFYSGIVHSADIGLGRVYAIKNYDFSSYKGIKVYLETDATRVTEACKDEQGFIEAELTLSKHSRNLLIVR
jgi:repressor of nif and glnA expression